MPPMKKIMILGIGPIAGENAAKFHGGGNRAWHLTKPLLDRGAEVVLVCMRITDKAGSPAPDEICKKNDGLTYYSVDEVRRFGDDDYLRSLIAEHKPDALAGACDYPAARAAAVAGDMPLWADIHGYPMGEAQAKAFRYNEQGYIHHFWNIHREVLLRGDRFSVTSERQRMALIGELGTMGRLNGYTFGEPLVTQIPIGWDPEASFQYNHRKKEDEMIVFSCGGYNLWCDADTMFQGLEKAMERDKRIRFLSTGGAIDGHDEKTYPHFQHLVSQSRFRDRFDLRGWVSGEELNRCFNRAHLGFNVDFPCYETLIGARNRLTEFMARGVPILTTLGTEISQILFYKGMALSAPMQNPAALANEIVLAADHPDKIEKLAHAARQLFEMQYTYHATAKEFVEWCENPAHSCDYGQPPVTLDYRRLEAARKSPESFLSRLRKKVKR
ncbi:MAG: glycosyltransferase [Candidatus Omnitrophota bacterium]